MELVEHEKVRLTDRHSEFWYAGLDFMGSGREKVRTKRFYSQKSSSIQPRTNPPKVYSYVCSCPDIGIRISYIYGFFPFPTVSVSFRWVGERDDSDKNSRYRIRKKNLGKIRRKLLSTSSEQLAAPERTCAVPPPASAFATASTLTTALAGSQASAASCSARRRRSSSAAQRCGACGSSVTSHFKIQNASAAVVFRFCYVLFSYFIF